jgi:hypothetical protein
MTMVIITYDLAEGITRAEYAEWSREVDQVIAARQPGIRRYEVFAVDGAGVGEVNCDVVEVIEADSVEAWEKVNQYPEMKPVYEGFLKLCDPDSVRLLFASPV